MDSLERLKIYNSISNFLKEKLKFNFPFKAYLFGSILKNGKTLNDVDMLIVYFSSTETMLDEINNLKSEFEMHFQLCLDVTILSNKELNETQFLKKIKKYKLLNSKL